jgi:hypothetical protein
MKLDKRVLVVDSGRPRVPMWTMEHLAPDSDPDVDSLHACTCTTMGCSGHRAEKRVVYHGACRVAF